MSDIAKATLIVFVILLFSAVAGFYFGTEPLCNSLTS
jgi:hypothetical protein